MPQRSALELLEKIHQLNKKFGLIEYGDRVLVAVSSGADSVALLELLVMIQSKLSLTLCVAHVHHGLQKNNDLAFEYAKKISKKHGLKFFDLKTSALSYAKHRRLSLEEAGREIRYSFFEKIAKKHGFAKIATAHTLNDQAETMLLNLIRGSGLRGLCAIPAKRNLNGKILIRPLLGCAKPELVSFLKDRGVDYIEDPTNRDSIYTRNKIRNHLIPWIEKNMNPQIQNSLLSLQASCQEALTYLDRTAGLALQRVVPQAKKGSLKLKIPSVQALDPFLQSEVLYQAYSRVRGNGNAITSFHRSKLLQLLLTGKSASSIQLPGHIRAVRRKNWLCIEKLSIIPNRR